MTTVVKPKSGESGSVLMIALLIALILGIGLASYLMLVRSQNVSTFRSHAWNASLALAEAGVEEALAQLNPSALVGTNIDRGANGWSLGADGSYHVNDRTSLNGHYNVAFTSHPLPIIYATGYVTIPSLSTTISRGVVVTTTHVRLFRAAMAARYNVDLKGNKIATDSFDSMDPNYSTDGLYDPAKRKAGGDVACTEGLINVQNADVRGTLFTGPEGGYTMGAQGTVGDLSWPTGAGMQPGHYRNDFNMDFPEILPPYQTAPPPAAGTVNGTNYTWVLGNGDYMFSGNAGFKTGDTILVTGNARIYVTGDFIMQGQSSLAIAQYASIQLFVGGSSAAITTVNNAGNCASFTYFGLAANTSIGLSGNNMFLGSFYAPNAELTLSGGGDPAKPFDFQGSCAVNTIKMNGHFNFHFDENLIRKGPIRGFGVASWNEI